jgi:hypothetical protein
MRLRPGASRRLGNRALAAVVQAAVKKQGRVLIAALAGWLSMAGCGSGGDTGGLESGSGQGKGPPESTVPTAPPTTTGTTPPAAGGGAPPASCPTPPGKYTQEQIVAARPQVETMIANNFSSVGNGANSISVDLLPGREPLASQLLARFGDIVEIEIGETTYCGGPAISRRCDELPGTDALPPGLSLSLRLERSSIRATEGLGGELTIRNDAANLFEMEPGQPLTAEIVSPGTRTVVGTYSGAIAGTGYGLKLSNGQSDTIRVIVGTSRCDGERGSALPPGRYAVRVGIGHNEGAPGYLAPEVPLTIVGS